MSDDAPRPAVFLDRDGTINVDHGYVHRVEDLELIEGAAEAIAALNRAGKLVLVVTNQSGVARGLYTEVDVARFHEAMSEALAGEGAHVDAFYHCPNHPTEGIGRYRIDSRDRKPGTGMFDRARADFAIDVAASWMVGDKLDDMRFAKAAGLKALLVETGKGASASASLDEPAWFDVVADLRAAAARVLERDS